MDEREDSKTGSQTMATFDIPQVPTNESDSKTSVPLKEKPSGHYKNSLRRRRRDATIQLENKLQNVTTNNVTTPKPTVNSVTDSQTAAIIVTQVSGSVKHNVATTEATVPRDQRDDTSAQLFKAKNEEEEYDEENNEKDFNLYDYFDFSKVSDTNEKQKVEHSDEEPSDNDEEFIPDKDENKNDEEENEEITSTPSSHHGNDNSKESNDNEKFSREQGLGFDKTSAEHGDNDNFSFIGTRNGEGDTNNCATGTDDTNSADGNGNAKESGKRVCETSGGRLEPVNSITKEDTPEESEETSQENLDSADESLSENAKEQFEHIPLDYKHDEVNVNTQKQSLKSKKRIKPHIKLGDTRVNIEDITLPDIIFKDFNDEYFEKLRKKHKNYYDDEETDDDDENEDNEKEDNDENEKSEETNERRKENLENITKDDANKTNKNDTIEKENEKDDEDDADAEDEDDDTSYYYTPDESKEENNDKKQSYYDDSLKFNPGYEAFDISDVKENIKDYSNGIKFVEEYNIQDPDLKTAVEQAVTKSKQTEKDVGSEDNPKYNYYWTLEYGQPV